MADDDVTVVLDGEGAIVTTGSGALLALELTTIENSGLISSPDEDSNPPAFGIPLLGTSTPQVLEISRGSSKKRSPESVCYTEPLHSRGQGSSVSVGNNGRKTGRGCSSAYRRKCERSMSANRSREIASNRAMTRCPCP